MSDIRDSYTNHTPYTHGGVEDFMDQTRPAAPQLLPDSRSGEARSCNVRGGGHGYCFTSDGTDIAEAIIARVALACPRYSTRYVASGTSEAQRTQPRASYCLKR